MELKQLYHYHGTRAYKARLAHHLAPWIFVFEVLAAALVFVGFGLLFIGSALGWAVIGLLAVPVMIARWHKRDLSRLKPVQNGERVDQLLDAELLGLMPHHPTPQQIAQVLSRTSGGVFFAVRFGVGGGFLEQLVSTNRDDTPAVFTEALSIAGGVGGRISAGVLVLAMVRQLPAKTTLLGHLQLDEEDLIRGIKWYHHLDELVEVHKNHTAHQGGIGRDWSFGWIPTLSRFGQNLSNSYMPTSPMREELVSQLLASLDGGRPVISLVGQNGVGKTQIVHQLASRLMNPDKTLPQKLRYQQVFMLDATSILSAGNERGKLEATINAILTEAYLAKNIILCLDNAQVFFEDGVGSVNISGILTPIMEAGRLPMILLMDEQRYLEIGKRLPTVTTAAQRVSLAPTDETDTLSILEEQLPIFEYRHKVTYMYQAVKEAYKLSKRYVYDVAMPGQAISLMESAAEYAEEKLVTAKSVQQAVEKTIGVKTSAVDDDSERETLLNLESLIHKRMIGQDRAVNVVSDALRRARAGVRNQQRPVGTFLFLGPTGVGKTELAKSLAAVYFGGEDNIVRLDMNEFVSSDDVSRLIADGTEDPSSLTAQVMKKPFSVILLDEIEKAHSSVLSTLLQLLDEGILRDTRNREVSFRDTIVIATSNAGADRIQEYIHRGYRLEQFEETFVNELISSHLFHPEFLNRFDEMVVFRPLEKNELLQVVDLILASVNKNMEQQKITVTVSDEAKSYLVEAGYDPRLGARPMRRVVQRAVESTVAKQVLAQQVQPGGTVEIGLDQVKAILDSKQKADQLASQTTLPTGS